MADQKKQDILTIIDQTSTGVHAISGSQAFSRYNWLKDIAGLSGVGLNKAGNLRGIVISAKWRTVYKISGGVGDALLVLSFAKEAYRSVPEMERIFSSADSSDIKAARISSQVSGICLRTLTSAATGILSLANVVVDRTRYVNPIYWTDRWLGFNQFDKNIAQIDKLVERATVSVDNLTLGNNLYHIIEVKFR